MFGERCTIVCSTFLCVILFSFHNGSCWDPPCTSPAPLPNEIISFVPACSALRPVGGELRENLAIRFRWPLHQRIGFCHELRSCPNMTLETQEDPMVGGSRQSTSSFVSSVRQLESCGLRLTRSVELVDVASFDAQLAQCTSSPGFLEGCGDLRVMYSQTKAQHTVKL